MNWSLEDYILAGALLWIVVTMMWLVTRRSLRLSYRAGAAIAVFTSLAIFVSAGAVGIIGDEGNVANLLYLGALVLGFLGAFLSRFRADGLALTMTLVGAAIVLIGAGALVLKVGASGNAYPCDVIVATAAFSGAYFLSAWLFHRAAPAPLLAV